MEPLQEHLDVHLTTGKERSEAKGPVGTGQTRLHDAGCPSDHHEGDHSNNEMSRETPQTASQWSRGGKHHQPLVSRIRKGLIET